MAGAVLHVVPGDIRIHGGMTTGRGGEGQRGSDRKLPDCIIRTIPFCFQLPLGIRCLDRDAAMYVMRQSVLDWHINSIKEMPIETVIVFFVTSGNLFLMDHHHQLWWMAR